MAGVSSFSVGHYKSSLWALCASFFRSRERLRDRLKELQREKDLLKREQQRVRDENRALIKVLQQTDAECRSLVAQQAQPFRLPDDPHLKGHQFGPRMMALCCALANLIGFRSTERVLPLISQWLQVEFDVPSHDTIRLWTSRNGVAILQESVQFAPDWIWMIDHSVQLGKMCVLVVLGIRQSELPVGRPLRRDDMKPLAVVPTLSRTKEQVGEALVELADQTGAPISIASDGAAELHEGVKWLENKGFEVVLVADVKHLAANLLKKTLGQDKRFTQFDGQIGKTTACIQQTELDHFLAPTKKTKCRFMNLDKLIDWAEMVRFHLKTPRAPGNRDVSAERLTQKLGWLLDFERDLEQWRECRQVVSAVLRFTNREGVYAGATEAVKKQLAELNISSPMAQQVLKKLVAACETNEQKLVGSSYAELRVPCSTEVLESSLGRFKSLQRHHNRGTFTTLLAIYPTLFETTPAHRLAERLKRVPTKGLKEWLEKAGLTNSTQARKAAAYEASRPPHQQENN